MKYRLRLLISVMLMTPLIGLNSLAFVHAEEITTSSQQSEPTSSQEATETETKVLEDTQAADYKTKLQERLTKRKQELKTKLTKAQEARVKARCKAAQTIIVKISTHAKETNTSRTEVYNNIIKHLTSLSTKLKDAGKDTTDLDKEIADLQTKIDTFNTDMTQLRQAAADLSNMDCSSDPSSFKASLESVRSAREAVAKDSQAIRTYITETVKTTLNTLKGSVSTTKEGGDQ